MKKSLSLFLSLILVVTAIPLSAIESFAILKSGDYQYIVLNDGSAEIKKYKGSDSAVTVPSELDGIPVSSIGINAFFCVKAYSISLPETLRTINNRAFYASEITTLEIPVGVTSIGKFAFYRCRYLRDVIIPNTVTNIGDSAFSYCTSLESIALPDSCIHLGKNVFDSCTSLENVNLGNFIEEIPSGLFYGCLALKEINISQNVSLINTDAYCNCSSLENINVDCENSVYSSVDGVLLSKDLSVLLCFPEGKTDNTYEIPQGVTGIAEKAFFACRNLRKITLPDRIVHFGVGIFANCSSLKDVELPNNMTGIPADMFNGCTSLEEIIIPNSVNEIGNNAFYNCKALKRAVLSQNLVKIGNYAFYNCDSLSKLHIPRSVMIFGTKAVGFADCAYNFIIFGFENTAAEDYAARKKLKFVNEDTLYDNISFTVLEDGTAEINAFYGDETEYEIPDIIDGRLVTGISNYAFSRCSQLEKIKIPDCVNHICSKAFDGTAYYNNPENWENGVLYIGNYLIASKNEEVPAIYTVKDGTVLVADMGFAYCRNLEQINLPNTLRLLGRNSFIGCTSLESVSIPEGTESIGDYAFMYCEALRNITIPDSVKYIGCEAVHGSGYYNNPDNWEDGVLYIGNHLVCSDTSDDKFGVFHSSVPENYVIKDGTVSVAACAFNCCPTLKTVVIPEGVTAIEAETFSQCTALQSVTLPQSVTRISFAAFGECPNLKSVLISPSVTEIGEFAFGFDYDYSNNVYVKLSDFTVFGYFYSEGYNYAGENGFDFVNLCEITEFDIRENSVLTLRCDEKTGNVFVYTDGKCNKAGSVIEQFEDGDVIYSVCRNGVELSAKTNIRTGDTVKCINKTSGVCLAEASVVLYGDVNGDGSVDIMDAIEVDLISNNMHFAYNEYARAADVNDDGKITSVDYSIIKTIA